MLEDSLVADSFVLRRKLSPYMGLTVILALITLMLMLLSIHIISWEPLYASLVFWFFFGVLLFVGTRYKVFWENKSIVEVAYGKQPIRIKIDEISSVEHESSELGELLSFNRPQRRITIVGREKSIDISLRHFRHADVSKLLELIKISRPDLPI